jgi:hypothetical protein
MKAKRSDLGGQDGYELLSQAVLGLEITVRDDRCEAAELLDAAAVDRRRGGRFRLVDTGRFGASELEWLAQAGADLYTSDEAGRTAGELGLLAAAAARGAGIVAYFLYGAFGGAVAEIAQSGVYLHVSNREAERDAAGLADLAYACRRSGAWLVHYQHGPLAGGFGDVVRNGGWLHLSDEAFDSGEPLAPFLELSRDAAAAGAGVVLHLENGLEAAAVLDLIKAGAFVIFGQAHDFRSPLREAERRADRRVLGFRAYYLTSTFLP